MAEKLEYKGDQEFKPYMSYEVRMAYQAGYAQWKEWPCEGETLHAGIGWFHPFGKSHYYAILGDCEEKKAFPSINISPKTGWKSMTHPCSASTGWRTEIFTPMTAYSVSGQRGMRKFPRLNIYTQGHPLQRYCGRNRQIRGRPRSHDGHRRR